MIGGSGVLQPSGTHFPIVLSLFHKETRDCHIYLPSYGLSCQCFHKYLCTRLPPVPTIPTSPASAISFKFKRGDSDGDHSFCW